MIRTGLLNTKNQPDPRSERKSVTRALSFLGSGLDQDAGALSNLEMGD